jgi:hypothetical protein
MLLQKLTARVVKHRKNPLGRYIWQEFLLEGTRTLMVVTVFQVIQRCIKGSGPTMSVMKQWQKLTEKGIKDPRPRQQTLNNSSKFLQPYKKEGNKIIVMIEANDPIVSTAMDNFFDGLNLCNLMADYLPLNPPSTYQRGQNKINHIVGTMGINLVMTHAYVLPYGTGDFPKSDHAICGIDLSMDVLCGITPESLYNPTHSLARQLWSTDVKAASRYVELVEQ